MSDLKPGQIEKLLVELSELKEKLLDAKAVLKGYKIESERLTQLSRAKKQMTGEISEEKKKIEDAFMEDKDFAQAKDDELQYKSGLREKTAELRKLMTQVNPAQQLATYEYNIKGEPVKMQVERVAKIYLNGKEQK